MPANKKYSLFPAGDSPCLTQCSSHPLSPCPTPSPHPLSCTHFQSQGWLEEGAEGLKGYRESGEDPERGTVAGKTAEREAAPREGRSWGAMNQHTGPREERVRTGTRARGASRGMNRKEGGRPELPRRQVGPARTQEEVGSGRVWPYSQGRAGRCRCRKEWRELQGEDRGPESLPSGLSCTCSQQPGQTGPRDSGFVLGSPAHPLI